MEPVTEPEKRINGHQSALLLAGAISLILWVAPVLGFLLLPLQYLNTHLHELCHAISAVATGGEVAEIKVFAAGNGVTLCSGSPWIVPAAGYLGAVVIGALVILFGRSERGARACLRVIAAGLAFSLVCWVRGDLVGVVSCVGWIVVLFLLSTALKERDVIFAAQFVGVQQCLMAVQSLYVLFRISAFQGQQSDAENMARYTGIPALFWAVLWGGIGLTALWLTLRLVWARPLPADPPHP
jgi:hypothetical protein